MLRQFIELPMKKMLLVCVLICLFSGVVLPQVYQLSNPGFEVWDGNGSDDEPTHWNGFPSASCNLIVGCGSATATRHEKSTDIRPGSSGSYSCKLFATEITILGNTIVANGTLTTGQIRIGSTTPTSNQNYNITRTANPSFRQPLNAKPDSISFWAKFVCPSSVQQARMSATIHGNYDYRDPEGSDPSSANHVVAKAIHNFSRGNQNWNKYVIPFDYNFPASTPSYILLTFTTNKNAGEGSASDFLYIDDIELIYNPRLSNLMVNGVAVQNFHPDITDYYLSVPCFSNQVISASPASQNATMQITQPTYSDPVGHVLVQAGNVSKLYSVHFSYETVTQIAAEVCTGDAYSDNWFSLPVQQSAGTFMFDVTTFTSVGCDSVIRLTLTVNPSFYPDTIQATICNLGTYDFYGNILSVAGMYDTILHTVHGCDSLVVLNLEVGDYYLFTIFASICEGEIYDQNGFYQSVSGVDTLFFQATDGCDSMMVLNLTVYPVYAISIYDTITKGEHYSNHGFDIEATDVPGEYEYFRYLQAASGCDSTVILYLSVQELIEEPEEDRPEFAMSVYPNPAADYLTIELTTTSSAKFMYEFYDAYGGLRKTGIINKKNVTVYLNEINSGVYILRVSSSAGEIKTTKIIKFE